MPDDETNGAPRNQQRGKVAPRRPVNRLRKKKVGAKKARKRPDPTGADAKARRRGRKPYPVAVFEDTLSIARGIITHAAGEPVRRLRLLELLDLNPSAQATRDLITNSGNYGLTSGNHSAEQLQLTEKGRKVVDPRISPRESRKAAFDLAIAEIAPFKRLYDVYSGRPMPSLEVMQDQLVDLDTGDRKPCVDVFVGNAKFVGLLKTIGGTKHLLKIEDALDELARSEPDETFAERTTTSVSGTQAPTDHRGTDFETVCFFIAPIGDKKSADAKIVEQRRHSDTILNQYVRRAIEEQSLKVVRADEIAEPGMISKQIIDYILKSRLVIADLSYNNPNVFYELCLRHATGKPTVHVIRKGDKIPFDLKDFRTVEIILDDVHEAITEIDTHRADIANHVRQALTTGETKDNPILTHYPNARFVYE